MTRRQSLLLLALAAIWGGSYALITVALDDGMPWAWVAFWRIALGALVVVPLAVRRVGVRAIVVRPRWTPPVALAQIAVPLLLIAWGQRRLDSGLAGVLIATAPLFTVLLAARVTPGSGLGVRGLVGVGVGFAGVVLLFGADLSGDGRTVVAGLALVTAALGYGIGGTLASRRLRGVPPLAISAGALAVSVPVAGVAAALSGAPPMPSAGAAAALLVLGAVGTGIAWVIFFGLVAEVGPSRTILVTYLAPVFAIGYGATLLDEPVTAGVVGGVVLILVGCVLGTRGGRPRSEAPAAP